MTTFNVTLPSGATWTPTFVAELDLTAFSAQRPLPSKYVPLPHHPALIRDFSVVFPEDVPWKSIAFHVMKDADHAENVELFDIYQGEGLPAGHRSLAFA